MLMVALMIELGIRHHQPDGHALVCRIDQRTQGGTVVIWPLAGCLGQNDAQ
jgi:hypothetical protein